MRFAAFLIVGASLIGCSRKEPSTAEAYREGYGSTKARLDGANRAENEHWMSLLPNAGITQDMSPTERAKRVEIGLKANVEKQIASMPKSP